MFQREDGFQASAEVFGPREAQTRREHPAGQVGHAHAACAGGIHVAQALDRDVDRAVDLDQILGLRSRRRGKRQRCRQPVSLVHVFVSIEGAIAPRYKKTIVGADQKISRGRTISVLASALRLRVAR